MEVASNADARRYDPNRYHRGDDWEQWRSTTEDEVPDHEAVKNLLQHHHAEEIAESSNLMREGNVDREYSEEDVPEGAEDDNDMGTRSEDERFTAVQKGKQKMVRMP
jgi:hypothetical protein